MEGRAPPRRREGRELTEAVERLRAGGVVLLHPTQTPVKDGDKNNGRAPTRNHPLSTTTQEHDTIMNQTTQNGTTQQAQSSNPISHLETLAGYILGKAEKNEPVAKVELPPGQRVTTVRTLGEKAVDGGIIAGAVFVGTTAAIAVGKYVFGIGKAPKGVPAPSA